MSACAPATGSCGRTRAPAAASRGRGYILDGELFDAERVEVSMGPEITLRGV